MLLEELPLFQQLQSVIASIKPRYDGVAEFTMQAMTVSQAQQNLSGVIAHVVDDAEPVIICTDGGQQVVCLSLDEFNSWKETLYLLSNPG
jgi:prevent-host-death family protein